MKNYTITVNGNVYDVTKDGKYIRYAYMKDGKLIADCGYWEYIEVET